MTRKSSTCGVCGGVGHYAPRCPSPRPIEDPPLRPSGVRLPLYLAPLPVVGEVPRKSIPRVFDHVLREETKDAITHVWKAPDGRTITATGPNRPNGCASPAWHWEGRIVLRKVASIEHARHGLPSFVVTETAP